MKKVSAIITELLQGKLHSQLSWGGVHLYMTGKIHKISNVIIAAVSWFSTLLHVYERIFKRPVNMIKELEIYYKKNGISALDFHCRHYEVCKNGNNNFTEAKETFVGTEYAKGTLPRLLFASLDSGDGDSDPKYRTLEAVRNWEENECDVLQLPKNKHWYRTHELAWIILKKFKTDLDIKKVGPYFAHMNSAKCCMNNAGRRQADWRLFENCREYVRGEIIILNPDIIITQRYWAKIAIERSFDWSNYTNSIENCSCPFNCTLVNNKKILWIHTYHPRYFGGFNRQRRECFGQWADVIYQFVRGSTS